MVSHVILLGVGEQHTKHVTYKIADHFVWCPTYRKAVLTGDVAQFVESEMRRLWEEEKGGSGGLQVQEDHVHLFLSSESRTAPSLLSHTPKGITARQRVKPIPVGQRPLLGGPV